MLNAENFVWEPGCLNKLFDANRYILLDSVQPGLKEMGKSKAKVQITQTNRICIWAIWALVLARNAAMPGQCIIFRFVRCIVYSFIPYLCWRCLVLWWEIPMRCPGRRYDIPIPSIWPENREDPTSDQRSVTVTCSLFTNIVWIGMTIGRRCQSQTLIHF